MILLMIVLAYWILAWRSIPVHAQGDAGQAPTTNGGELLQSGMQQAETLISGLEEWLQLHQYENTAQLIGSMSQESVAEPAAFERANYMKVLTSLDRDLNL